MDLRQIVNIEDGVDRRAKIEELFGSAGSETNMMPLYDAWAKNYEEVRANILLAHHRPRYGTVQLVLSNRVL